MGSRISELETGAVPAEATLAETVELARENARLEKQRLETEVALNAAKEKLDTAQEREIELVTKLETAGAAKMEAEQLQEELRHARSHIQRLQQEADIAAAHHREVENQHRTVEDTPTGLVDMPNLVGEALAHIYAVAFGSLHLQNKLIERATQVRGTEAVQAALGDEGRLASQMLVDLIADAGAPKDYVDELPEDPVECVQWMLDHSEVLESLLAEPDWQHAAAQLDPDSLAHVETIIDAGLTVSRAISAQVRGMKDQLSKLQVPVVPVASGARAIEDGRSVRPGQPWPFPKGDDTWVLSAQRQEIRRPGRRAGRLQDLLGEAGESAVVTAFLQIRPEGGRIFFDEDGDASTYVDGVLIYLGLLPQLASVD